MSHLNSDHLRSFIAIYETGSMTAGADRIGRSQSAISLQMRLLEDTIGQPVFRRHGRGVTLTPAGEALRPVAVDVVRALDRTLSDLRGEGLQGKIRIGMPDDHTRADLARIISEFAALHRNVELEVQCELGDGYDAALQSGALDIAIFEVPETRPGDVVLREDTMIWMCSKDRDLAGLDTLPIAIFDQSCWWRALALESLAKNGRRHQVVFTSESAAGVRAAAQSGIAAALLSVSDQTADLRALSDIDERYPSYLVMRRAKGAKGPVCDAMCAAVENAFAV